MQSWGTRARWDVRDSADEPTKSGLIGLLGCALGFPVGDPRMAELDGLILLGIRVEQPGRPLVDFHTVTGVLPQANGATRGTSLDPATIVSPREYLQDGAFLAVLAGPEDTLTRCAEALCSPKWPIYLGRRSCPPTRPVIEGLTREYATCEDALRRHPWDWGGRATLKSLPDSLRCTIEDPSGAGVRSDRVKCNPARVYGSRRVRVFYVNFPGAKEGPKCTSRS